MLLQSRSLIWHCTVNKLVLTGSQKYDEYFTSPNPVLTLKTYVVSTQKNISHPPNPVLTLKPYVVSTQKSISHHQILFWPLKPMLWRYSKESSQWDDSSEYPKHRFERTHMGDMNGKRPVHSSLSSPLSSDTFNGCTFVFMERWYKIR